jgi:hypothetical protein
VVTDKSSEKSKTYQLGLYISRIIRANCAWKRKVGNVLVVIVGIGLFGSSQVAWSQNQAPLECDIPQVDIPGKDLTGFPRFPGSIKVQYTEEADRFSFSEKTKVKGMSLKFLSNADLKSLMEFYSKNVVDKGWRVISSQYMSSEKATLTLEKKPDRVILTLEPNMEPAPPAPGPGRTDLSRASQPGRPIFLRTKCYSVSVFLYKIPSPGTNTENAGFPLR